MMNNVLGPLDEDERLRRIAPAIAAIIPVEDRGRHELLRIAASLAQGLPDRYAQEILRAAAALTVHPMLIDERLLYTPSSGTLARIGSANFILGCLEYLRQLYVEPHKAERNVIEVLERQGNVVYAVVAQRDAHCLGLIAIKATATGAVAESRETPNPI